MDLCSSAALATARPSANRPHNRLRVLYSFPHRLGAERICYTAWQQVNGLAKAGASVLVMPASISRPVPETVEVACTLARGRFRLPYRVLGNRRTFALHDAIVAHRLRQLAGSVDIVHAWPQGSLRTLTTARQLGIPTVLERPNAHTRFAYEVVRQECERIGVPLPQDHEHAFNEHILTVEEKEFRRATKLLCPSEFVVDTFLDRGFAPQQLVRHFYGFDESTYYPAPAVDSRRGLTMLFVGVCAVRKGLHFALEAWLASAAHHDGQFLIAGDFLPAYQAKLAPLLAHPSVKTLGHRTDVPSLMRQSDLLVLPSIEEGFGLVCTEAMGSGCVPLVSSACTELCRDNVNAMVHAVGDTRTLSAQITALHEDRDLLLRLRTAGLRSCRDLTWDHAGQRLLEAYRETINSPRHQPRPRSDELPTAT